MTEVRFYHLRTKTLEQALPEILLKALDQGRRAVVRTSDLALATKLNEQLWTFRPDSFLPHGIKGDDYAAAHPVWLTDGNDNPNGADLLILAGGVVAENIGDFALACEILDGNDPGATEAARGRWKDYTARGFTVTYWQQTDRGGWEQKV